ncbi:nitroreductase family protein [Spirillospora sp. NPDC049652]
MSTHTIPPAAAPAEPPLGPRADPAEALRVIRTRSVVRDFTGEPVSDADAEALAAAMVAAPNGANLQAWAFIIVREPRRLLSVRAFAPGVIGVPSLLLIACLDHSRYADVEDARTRREGKLCVAMAVENFLLAAHALGLGACPSSSFLPEPVRVLLDLPAHLEPVMLVAAGHPAHPPQPSVRRPIEEVVRYDSYA